MGLKDWNPIKAMGIGEKKEISASDLTKTMLLFERLGIDYQIKIDFHNETTEISVEAKELNRVPPWHSFYVTFIFDSIGRFRKIGVYE